MAAVLASALAATGWQPSGASTSALGECADDSLRTLAIQRVMGDALYFDAWDEARGQTLWRTDGTAEGTRRLMTIRTGSETPWWEAGHRSLGVAGGYLYFAATAPRHGTGLWRTDGTPGGTRLVKAMRPGPQGSDLRSSSVRDGVGLGDILLFVANDSRHGHELWRSDGTARGTRLVKDIRPGAQGSRIALSSAVLLDDTLLITAHDGVHGLELWRSDGTAEGTNLVKDIRPGPKGSVPDLYDSRLVGSTLYFAALGDSGRSGFWRTDGTNAGTSLLKEFEYDADYASGPEVLAVLGNIVYFIGDDGEHGWELWRTDGTASGTRLVKDVAPEAENGAPDTVWAVGDTLYFVPMRGHPTDAENRHELWRTDGTPEGTNLVKAIPPRDGFGSHVVSVIGDTILLQDDDQALDGWGIWRSDGTSEGTVLLREFGEGRVAFEGFVVVDDRMYFAAADERRTWRLWVSDGTPDGTTHLREFESRTMPSSFTVRDSVLYFTTADGDDGCGLWRTDGTSEGTARLAALGRGRTGFDDPLYQAGDLLYFDAARGCSGAELWRTDGTPEGTVRLMTVVRR